MNQKKKFFFPIKCIYICNYLWDLNVQTGNKNIRAEKVIGSFPSTLELVQNKFSAFIRM